MSWGTSVRGTPGLDRKAKIRYVCTRMLSAKNKLPRNHVDFEYASSKNPYYKKLLELQPWAYTDAETEHGQGEWRKKFQVPTKPSDELWVEIGCNTGHVVREWAKSHPALRFIGLECKFKAAHRGAEKAKQAGLKNFMMLRANGERLPFVFGKSEIDRLFLFFPDPWPPKSQWKKRIFQKNWLTSVAPLLKPGALFEIRTDHDGYFEWMLEQIEGVAEFEVVQVERNKHAHHPNPTSLNIPEVTLFERLFIKDGIPIKQLLLKKK